MNSNDSASPVIGIVIGLVLQGLGGLLRGFWLIGAIGIPVICIGWLLFVGSCCWLARSKGYPTLLGLIGIPLHIVGPLILFFLPNNSKNLSRL